MSKKACPFLWIEYDMNIGQDFLDTQYTILVSTVLTIYLIRIKGFFLWLKYSRFELAAIAEQIVADRPDIGIYIGTECPRSFDPFYMGNFYIKKGQDFLERQQ